MEWSRMPRNDDSMTTEAPPGHVGSHEGLGPLPEREAWVRNWFSERYKAGDVFEDGAEALTLDAALRLVSDAQAAERERWRVAVLAGHLYEGDCPDEVNGFDSRDPACPLCALLGPNDRANRA